jgi:hypothetical protein
MTGLTLRKSSWTRGEGDKRIEGQDVHRHFKQCNDDAAGSRFARGRLVASPHPLRSGRCGDRLGANGCGLQPWPAVSFALHGSNGHARRRAGVSFSEQTACAASSTSPSPPETANTGNRVIDLFHNALMVALFGRGGVSVSIWMVL